jgi:two-component system, response regulator PdtaR
MTISAPRSLRVLIVEDDAIISMLLAELLAELGYNVCATAATEAEAVAAAIRDKPDLMIVDARLRGGSGVSAVEEILRLGPVAHIFLSGAPGSVRALRPDAVVIGKPFRQAELVRAIETALAAPADG